VGNQAKAQVGRSPDHAVPTSEPELRAAYAMAVSHGAESTWCVAAEERGYGTLRLLTLATLRLPDLFLYAHVAETFSEDPEVDGVPRVVVDAVRVMAAGALLLAHRALETHASDVGYGTGVWVDRALEQAGARLAGEVDADVPVLLDEARRAAIALTRATAATADDRMLLPAELAGGLAHLLAVYVVAATLR
jgi:FAD/FMN-containing dehydrogenase